MVDVGKHVYFFLQMMRQAGFSWDNTLSAKPTSDGVPFWPQTLDYLLRWKCERGGCPVKPHPGIWEIPLNQFFGYYIPIIQNYKRAAMIRAAMRVNETADSALQVLRQVCILSETAQSY
ncbi:MAG: hypothetical protein GY843_17720 [Neptuniibacter sp.]|nr:hypothetical protein [Neptuniibacter sp.]